MTAAYYGVSHSQQSIMRALPLDQTLERRRSKLTASRQLHADHTANKTQLNPSAPELARDHRLVAKTRSCASVLHSAVCEFTRKAPLQPCLRRKSAKAAKGGTRWKL
jgi:hypothetical protein